MKVLVDRVHKHKEHSEIVQIWHGYVPHNDSNKVVANIDVMQASTSLLPL